MNLRLFILAMHVSQSNLPDADMKMTFSIRASRLINVNLLKARENEHKINTWYYYLYVCACVRKITRHVRQHFDPQKSIRALKKLRLGYSYSDAVLRKRYRIVLV